MLCIEVSALSLVLMSVVFIILSLFGLSFSLLLSSLLYVLWLLLRYVPCVCVVWAPMLVLRVLTVSIVSCRSRYGCHSCGVCVFVCVFVCVCVFGFGCGCVCVFGLLFGCGVARWFVGVCLYVCVWLVVSLTVCFFGWLLVCLVRLCLCVCPQRISCYHCDSCSCMFLRVWFVRLVLYVTSGHYTY